MSGPPHEQVAEALNSQRQRRRLKWNAVAKALGITPQHLLRIRQGTARITDDVAVAIDDFLNREPGHTRSITSTSEQGIASPTSDQIIAMTARELAAHYVHLDNESGKKIADKWLFDAMSLRLDANDGDP